MRAVIFIKYQENQVAKPRKVKVVKTPLLIPTSAIYMKFFKSHNLAVTAIAMFLHTSELLLSSGLTHELHLAL